MNVKNKTKTIGQKTQSLKKVVVESVTRFTPIRTLVKNRRAVSAVMSNLILIGAVVAIGLVALGYTRTTSINYQTQYAETMNSDIGKLKESLIFEYVHYDSSSKQLSVYVLNSGTVDVVIKSVFINSSPISLPTINRMTDDQPLTIIGKGVEAYFALDLSSINLQTENTIKLETESDSNFAYNFLV